MSYRNLFIRVLTLPIYLPVVLASEFSPKWERLRREMVLWVRMEYPLKRVDK